MNFVSDFGLFYTIKDPFILDINIDNISNHLKFMIFLIWYIFFYTTDFQYHKRYANIDTNFNFNILNFDLYHIHHL